MPVQVVKYQSILLSGLFIHEFQDSFTTAESIIIEDDNPTRDHAIPNPVHDILCGLVNVNVNVAQPKAAFLLLNDVRRVVGKNSFEHLHVVEMHLVENKILNAVAGSIGVFAALVVGVVLPCFHDPTKRIAEIDGFPNTARCGPLGDQGSRSSAPNADLKQATSWQLTALFDELPEFPEAIEVNHAMRFDFLEDRAKLVVRVPGRIGCYRRDGIIKGAIGGKPGKRNDLEPQTPEPASNGVFDPGG